MFAFFFFNDTATTEIYTLSLHDALPISLERGFVGCSGEALSRTVRAAQAARCRWRRCHRFHRALQSSRGRDRKSTRLNSSHLVISYAVFCLQKKKKLTTYRSRAPLVVRH